MDYGQILTLALLPVAAGGIARLVAYGLEKFNAPRAAHAEIDVKVTDTDGNSTEFRREVLLPLTNKNREGVLNEIEQRLSA